MATPTEIAKEFCDAFETSVAKCVSSVSVDRAACLSLATIYSDDKLEKPKTCTTKSCDKLADCIDATLGRPRLPRSF